MDFRFRMPFSIFLYFFFRQRDLPIILNDMNAPCPQQQMIHYQRINYTVPFTIQIPTSCR